MTDAEAIALYGGLVPPANKLGDPLLDATLEMLRDQRARLSKAVLATNDSMCRHYLAKVRGALAQPPMAIVLDRGRFGSNGYGPSIEAAISSAYRIAELKAKRS